MIDFYFFAERFLCTLYSFFLLFVPDPSGAVRTEGKIFVQFIQKRKVVFL